MVIKKWSFASKCSIQLTFLAGNDYSDSHHLQGVWNMQYKFHLNLIISTYNRLLIKHWKSRANLHTFMLYISTSVWVLRNPNAGRNRHFQRFCCKKPSKSKNFAANFSKKQSFSSVFSSWLESQTIRGIWIANK